MFKFLVFCSLAVVALGQVGFWVQLLERLRQGSGPVLLPVDHVHEYTVQYDDEHDIVIFVGSTDCYIVEAEPERKWDEIIADEEDLHSFTEAVYTQIQRDQHVINLSHAEASQAYHSQLEIWECQDKDVHKVAYRHSK